MFARSQACGLIKTERPRLGDNPLVPLQRKPVFIIRQVCYAALHEADPHRSLVLRQFAFPGDEIPYPCPIRLKAPAAYRRGPLTFRISGLSPPKVSDRHRRVRSYYGDCSYLRRLILKKIDKNKGKLLDSSSSVKGVGTPRPCRTTGGA